MAADWRCAARLKEGARTSGTQIWTGRRPCRRSRSRCWRTFSRDELGRDCETIDLSRKVTCTPLSSIATKALAVVAQQRLNRDLQALAAFEEGELDDAGRRRHDRANLLEQLHRRGHGAAGGEQVV